MKARIILAVLVLMAACIADSEAQAICVQWEQAEAAYRIRCGADQATVTAWYNNRVQVCGHALTDDAAGVRACIASVPSIPCGTVLQCTALRFDRFQGGPP